MRESVGNGKNKPFSDINNIKSKDQPTHRGNEALMETLMYTRKYYCCV